MVESYIPRELGIGFEGGLEGDSDVEARRIELITSLVVLAGPPGVGKTTLGEMIARRTNAIFVDKDAVKTNLYGEGVQTLAPGEEDTEINREAYFDTYRKAEELIAVERPVIIAATFASLESHIAIGELFGGVPTIVFQLRADEKTLCERIRKRQTEGSLSNVRTVEHLNRVLARLKPFARPDSIIDTTNLTPEQSLETVLNHLPRTTMLRSSPPMPRP